MTDDIDLKLVMSKMGEVIKQQEKYQFSRTRLFDNVKLIKEHLDEIYRLVEEINPEVSVGVRKKMRGNYVIILEELFEDMKHGQFVTRDYILTKYSSTENLDASYVLTCLKNMKGVDSARDGHKIRLFLK